MRFLWKPVFLSGNHSPTLFFFLLPELKFLLPVGPFSPKMEINIKRVCSDALLVANEKTNIF
jgi:hypothetical protein